MKTFSIFQWVTAANREAKSRKLKAEMTDGGCELRQLLAIALLALFAAFTASAQVNLNIGTLLPGEKITVTFDATINTPFPANTFAVSNQASFTATGVVLTSDDPDTGLINDPTITTLSVAPVITNCPGNQTTNNFPGTCGQTVPFPAAIAIGGDSAPVITYKLGANIITPPYSFPVASNVVTVTASNGVLPNATCSFYVLVLDKENPTITCPGNITNNTAPGQCTAVVAYSVTGSDNCPGQLVAQTAGLTNGATFPRGVTTNRFTVTDAAGNTNFCSFLVVVKDNEVPSITCPGNIVASNTPGLCSTIVNYNVTSSDNCPGQLVSQNSGLASGAAFPKGITTNRFTVLDTSGNTNTCSFTVTVIDAQPPTLSCSSNIVVSTAPGQCTATVFYSVTNSDNCPGQIMVQTAGLTNGAAFPKGVTTNSFTLTDGSSNTVSCSFTVTVNDTEQPAINCPADRVVNTDPGQCTAVVSYSITNTDNCPGQVLTQTGGLASGAAFPKGVTTNSFSVTDSSGNTNFCAFTVTVIDNEIPAITCPGDIVTNIAGVCVSNVVVSFTTNATDNCALTNVMVTPPSGSAFNIGTNVVTAIAYDSSGNTNTCTFNVIVLNTGGSPRLTISQLITDVVLSWSDAFTCFQLQQATDLSGIWGLHPGPFVPSGGNIYATNSIDSTNRFFRLIH